LSKEQMKPLSAIISFSLCAIALLVILFVINEPEPDPVPGEIWVNDYNSGNPFLTESRKLKIISVKNGYVLYHDPLGLFDESSCYIKGFKGLHDKWTGGDHDQD